MVLDEDAEETTGRAERDRAGGGGGLLLLLGLQFVIMGVTEGDVDDDAIKGGRIPAAADAA
jgi:hypothetical protein